MAFQKLCAVIPLFTIICSCSKNYNANPKVAAQASGTYTSIQSAFADLAVKSKIVTIDAGTGGTFMGNSGSRYVVPANAFKNSAGTIVTGNVQLEVKEYLKESDMLFSGVLPVSTTEPLISGGESYMSATQNGQKLSMAGTSKYQVNMPQNGPAQTGMQLFTGQQDPTSNTVTWAPSTDSLGGTVVYNGDTTTIISNTLEFCNADHFMSSPNWQTFTLTCSAPGVALTDTISAFTLYDNYKGVWPMLMVKGMGEEDHVPNIPVHFAVVAIINGNFYAGLLGATPTTGSNYNVILTKMPPSAFKAQIDAL